MGGRDMAWAWHGHRGLGGGLGMEILSDTLIILIFGKLDII